MKRNFSLINLTSEKICIPEPTSISGLIQATLRKHIQQQILKETFTKEQQTSHCESQVLIHNEIFRIKSIARLINERQL